VVVAINRAKHSELRNIAALQTLVMVGDLGSLTEAARRLGVTQQAVSARLQALERAVGRPLLVRGPKGRTLTSDGKVIADEAVQVLSALNSLDSAVDRLFAERYVLRAAASYTVAEYLFPRWLMQLSLAYGADNAQVTVTAVNSATVLDEVLNGLHHVGFVETPDLPAGLHHRQVGRDELVVVVAPNHPWASGNGPAVSVQDLAETALVCREAGSGTRSSYERMLRSRHPGVSIAPPEIEFPTTAAVKNAVRWGFAPAVLSLLSVREDLDYGRLCRVKVESRPFIRDITAVWPASVKTLSPPARQLIEVASRRN
jgi:DNA-binding transcriptional LysR family regulator